MKQQLLISAYQRISRRLFAKAGSVLHHDDDARDAIQEAFCRLWASPPDIERDSQAEGVLTVAVRNVSIDTLRRRQAHPTDEIPPDLSITDDTSPADRMELYREVTAITAQALSERDRMILLRRDRDEWSFEELAEEFGITAANARLIVARARRTVREIYNQRNSNHHTHL